MDGALGELSLFHQTHKFYSQGIAIDEAARQPKGLKRRCIAVRAGRNATGLCLEGHDLALSKLAAFREKDLEFVRTLTNAAD